MAMANSLGSAAAMYQQQSALNNIRPGGIIRGYPDQYRGLNSPPIGTWFQEKPPYVKGYGVHYSVPRKAYTYVKDSPGPAETTKKDIGAPVLDKIALSPVQQMIAQLEKELAPWLNRGVQKDGMV